MYNSYIACDCCIIELYCIILHHVSSSLGFRSITVLRTAIEQRMCCNSHPLLPGWEGIKPLLWSCSPQFRSGAEKQQLLSCIPLWAKAKPKAKSVNHPSSTLKKKQQREWPWNLSLDFYWHWSSIATCLYSRLVQRALVKLPPRGLQWRGRSMEESLTLDGEWCLLCSYSMTTL